MPPPQKLTQKQRLIQEAFVNAAHPMTPQEAWEAARVRQPGLGLATVYRAVKTLTDKGILHRIDIEDEVARYGACGGHKHHHHHHFYCRNCGRIYEVPDCLSDLSAMVPAGFQLQDHTITLYGICADCSVKDLAATG